MYRAKVQFSFQFIGFPSEWGHNGVRWKATVGTVSNLLGSPASGGRKYIEFARGASTVSNLLGSPASGVFVSNSGFQHCSVSGFQFIGFPSEWGSIRS